MYGLIELFRPYLFEVIANTGDFIEVALVYSYMFLMYCNLNDLSFNGFDGRLNTVGLITLGSTGGSGDCTVRLYINYFVV
jgi:hypothetical protein